MMELGKGRWFLMYQWVLVMVKSRLFSGHLEDCLDIIRQPLYAHCFY